MTNKPQLTAIICLRVSTPSQVNKAIDPEGYSIPNQREACHRYCDHNLGGVTVVDEVIEPGVSAKDISKRPHITELLEKVDRHRPDFVIYFDLSRSARNDYDAQWLWRELTERRGVLIQSTHERIDDTPNGRMIYSITAAVNANRIRQDAEKVKDGLARKFMEGGHQGPAPVGYRNDKLLLPGREVRVVLEDREGNRSDLVRQGFDLYASGNYSLATLTDMLDVMGLRFRATAKKPERPLSRASVYRMLTDDFYIGIVTFKGQKRPGIHDALIEETTFERVQQILAAHRASGSRGRKHDHFLIGDIFICKRCGCRLGYGRHRSKTGTRYEYFSCLSRVRPTGPCGARYLGVEAVEQAVEARHAAILYTRKQQDQLREAVREFVSARVEAAHQQADHHQRRLDALKGEQKNLLQLHHKGLVDDEVLAEEQERIRMERSHARQLVEHATHEVGDIMEALDEALSLVDETFPYADAQDPVLRKLINQATHTEIRPYLDEDGGDGHGTPSVLVTGRRDPFYEAADTVLGLDRTEATVTRRQDLEGGSSHHLGGFDVAGVRTKVRAPRCLGRRPPVLRRPSSCRSAPGRRWASRGTRPGPGAAGRACRGRSARRSRGSAGRPGG
jgi:DNA invertase Pin-like site-specific DNA recombinase